MESLKPILLLIVLGAVCYGVYVALNHAPPSAPEPATTSWTKPPQAGATSTATNMPAGGSPTAVATGLNAIPSRSKPVSPLGNPAMNSPSSPSSAPDAIGTSAPKLPLGGGSLPFGIGASSAHSAEPASTTSSAPPPNSAPDVHVDLPDKTAQISSIDNHDAAETTHTTAPDYPAADPDPDRAHRDYEYSMRTAESMLRGNKLVEALRELSKWYDHPALSTGEQTQLVELLGQLAGTVLYSRDAWLEPPYVVQAGDTLESIGQQCQAPWQLLAKINGIENTRQLTPGEQLKVVRGPFHAQLDLHDDWLALFVDGMYAGRFRVEVAGQIAKPEGTYPVVKFPSVQSGTGPGGAAYISLGGDLHVRVPDDAGTPGVSAVRISQRDMSDVFDMLSERSQVTIRR